MSLSRAITYFVSKNNALRAEKPIFHNAQPFLVERSETVFLLSLISKHEMLCMWLVMADGSLLTGRQHQQQTQNLVKIEINESVFPVFFFTILYANTGIY